MDDASDTLAFRRLVTSVAEKLTEEEIRRIVYIHLYTQRETLFQDANRLDVFVALEYADVFSPSRPEGLLNILEKDLNNRQLAQLVKDLIRQRKSKSRVRLSAGKRGVSTEIEGDSHMRMCYRVALAQTNVLVKHLDVLRQKVTGVGADTEGAREAVENISKIAESLAKLKEKAIEEVYDYQEEYDDVESRNPVFKEVEAELGSVKVNFNHSPQPAKKPMLKPKPNLKIDSWNAPPLNSNPNKSSSLPLLDGSTPQASDCADESTDDDYIIPTHYTDDIYDNEETGKGQLPPNPALPTKANSLPYLNLPLSIAPPFRPLPELPAETKAGNEDPIYDDIDEHTLLSRTEKPMQLAM